jgi:hypothetical protein
MTWIAGVVELLGFKRLPRHAKLHRYQFVIVELGHSACRVNHNDQLWEREGNKVAYFGKRNGEMMKRVALVILAILAIAPCLKADSDSTIYVFTGDPLTNSTNPSGLLPNGEWRTDVGSCTCNITGEMTFSSPLNLPTGILTLDNLAPSSYSFSVDGYTLTQNNSTALQLSLGQGAWGINILGNNGLEIFTNCIDGCGDDSTSEFGFFQAGGKALGYQQGNTGSWSVAVPEPAPLVLLGMGFVWLVLRQRCRD